MLRLRNISKIQALTDGAVLEPVIACRRCACNSMTSKIVWDLKVEGNIETSGIEDIWQG
jgi:hypothetical protein